MTDHLTLQQKREASFVNGDMAAERLFDLIHHRIDELKAQGFTQAQIADNIGATQQQVGHWIAEPRNMTVKSAGRLLYGLRAHLLFEMERHETILAGNSAATPAPKPLVVETKQSKAVYLPQKLNAVVQITTRTPILAGAS